MAIVVAGAADALARSRHHSRPAAPRTAPVIANVNPPSPATCDLTTNAPPQWLRPAPAETNTQLVPGQPTALTVCRYNSQGELLGSRVLTDAPTVTAVVGQLNGLPTNIGISCVRPSTDTTRLRLGYGDLSLLDLSLSDACPIVGNGVLMRPTVGPTGDALRFTLSDLTLPVTAPVGTQHTPGTIPEGYGLGMMLAQLFPATYAGVYGMAGTDFGAVVLETRRDPALEAYAMAHGDGLTISFALAARSRADVEGVRKQLESDLAGGSSIEGLDLTGWGIDDIDVRVSIGIYPATPAAIAALDRRYGTENIVVTQMQIAPAVGAGPSAPH